MTSWTGRPSTGDGILMTWDEGPPDVRTDPRPTHRRPARRLLPMAVVLAVLGLIGGQGAGATTIAAAEAHDAAEHLCKCKSCRGASSCCCAHKADTSLPEKRPAPVPASGKADAAEANSGPCVDSAPCGGGEGTPATPAGVASGKIATLTSPSALPPSADDQPLAVGGPARVPRRAASRLDDPPEVSSRA